MNLFSGFYTPLRILCIVLLLCIPGLPENTPSPVEDTGKDTFIINEIASPPDSSSDCLVTYLDYKKINDWATTLRMSAIEDSLPLTDGKAFFIVHPQITVPVNGLKKGERYFLYIDFVRYTGKSSPVNSTLKIFIEDYKGNREHVKTIEYSSVFTDKLFKTEIPFNLSNSGVFNIIIEEYSAKTGYWGIWDMIVSSKKIEDIEQINIDNRPELKEDKPKIFN